MICRKRLLLGACAVGLGILAGCEATQVGDVGQRPRQVITFAATAKYPGNAQSPQNWQAAAINDAAGRELTIYNLSGQDIPATALWVNGHWVRPIGGIPARSHVTLQYQGLVEQGQGAGIFSDAGEPVKNVEIQTPQGLYTVLGPANK